MKKILESEISKTLWLEKDSGCLLMVTQYRTSSHGYNIVNLSEGIVTDAGLTYDGVLNHMKCGHSAVRSAKQWKRKEPFAVHLGHIEELDFASYIEEKNA
jgi:hypothetical protein